MIQPRKVRLADVITEAKPGFACGDEQTNGVFQIRMNNVTRDGRLDTSKRRLVPHDHKGIPGTVLRDGDVLFNATNSPDLVGKTVVIRNPSEPTVFSNHFIRLRVDTSKLDPSYLARWLNSEFRRGTYKSMCRQWVNQATLGRDTLLGTTIPLLEVSEQRRIAEVLDHVDALREKRRKSIALLDDLTQSIFLDMFRDPRDGMLRETLTLGDVAEIQGGLQVTLKRKTLPISVPYLRVANVHRGGLDLSEIKQMNVTDRELERTALRKGDLLVVEGHGNPSEIGRVAVWDGSITTCTHQNHLIRVRVDESRMLPEYAESYLNSTVGRRHLLRSAKTTSGLNTISTSTVRSAPVMVPQLPLQEEFRERTRRISSAREKHQASLAHLDTLFSSIQSRAFRGELWQDDLKDL